ncbi:MAG: SLC13 family permease [Bacteroidales bacterium]|nr:SLC13 family permease [Candidatus Cacconaster merdequi]
MFLGLSVQAWITIATILTIFTLLLVTKLPADFVFLGGISVLFFTGVLDAGEAFSGFCSETVISIGFLFIVVAGLIHTGVLKWIVDHALGNPKTHSRAIAKIMAITASLSAFLNNTVVVALFVNVVKMWSKKLGITPSKLLIPLSYAAGMGGVCTLIGTPPNLIISELLKQSGGPQMGFFSTTLPGLFCLAVGITATILLRRLLPDRKSSDSELEDVSEYTVEFLVPTDNPLVGKSIEEAGLDNMEYGHLIEIIRFDQMEVSPVQSDEFIFGGDRLILSGNIDKLLEFKEKYRLATATGHLFHYDSEEKGRNLTAYIPFRSELIGRRMSDTDLESRNNFVLVAVTRKGEVLRQSPHNLILEAGDTLLIKAGRHCDMEKLSRKLHFFNSDDSAGYSSKTVISSLIMGALVILTALNCLSLMQACLISCFAMIATHCCSFEQARKSIDWSILMIFAASIALGTSITKTGIAQFLSNGILDVCGPRPFLVLALICTLGTFITEFISNTACAAIFFPIAYKSAIALGANPMTFCIGLMLAISSSFATPIGSPTHMLVYGPGNYRFIDFIKIGLPMNIIILAANLFITTRLFPL